jgi:transcriptional regulator with XRE-family HTH domain
MEKAEHFGDKIKALRKNHDVTLSDMAVLINLKSKGSLSTFKNCLCKNVVDIVKAC